MNKPKILHLIKTMDVGGAEKIVHEICKNLHKKYDFTIASSGGIFANDLESIGIKNIIISNKRSYNIVDFFKIYFSLKKIIKTNEFDIIHVHHRILQFILQLIIGRDRNIYTAHNLFEDYKQFFIRPKIYIAISEKVYGAMSHTMKLTIQHIKIINYGVNIPESQAPRKNEILFIGRLIKEKGILNLIEAIPILLKRNVFVKLRIIGSGNTSEILEKINSLKLNNQINLLKPSIKIEDIFANSSILVLPSSIPEGLPVSILEAMANNVIVLATLKGGVEQVLLNRKTGFILKDNKPQTIALELERIIKYYSKSDLNDIRKKARSLVKEKFNLKEMIYNYDKIYQKNVPRRYY